MEIEEHFSKSPAEYREKYCYPSIIRLNKGVDMIFEIWSEGYRATGESGGAHCYGKFEAESFDKAIELLLEKDPICKEHYQYGQYTGHRIWGCRLFDNEADARKSFG